MTQIEFERCIVNYCVPLYPKYRILPSIVIAQAILESGWGNSTLATKANALFGIKATGNEPCYTIKTNEYTADGKLYVTRAKFRAYNSWADSIKDHLKFLQSSRYTAVVGETNYRVAANELQKAGYATDPEYARKLCNLIESYGLHNYDIVATKDIDTFVKPRYCVQKGDTLTKIAAIHCMSVDSLAEINGITDKNKIKAGAILNLTW